MEQGAATGAPAAYGALTRAARRLALRLNRHDRLHQQAVHRELLAAMAALEEAAAERIDDVVAMVEAVRAQLIEVELHTARLADAPLPPADPAAWRDRLSFPAAGDGQPRRAVEVQTDVGALLVSAHDRVVHHVLRDTGVWEKGESDALRGFLTPGMTFVDIGAHVGYMTLLAAAAVGPSGRVIAFEPAPGNYELLQANLRRNGVTNAVAIPAAAWKETGPVTFSLDEFNTGDHRAYARPGAETFEVPGFALDDVIPGDVMVDVVKVDAQGTDHLALQGMARTLASCRPVLLVEYFPPGITELGDDPLAVLALYRDLGFSITVLGTESPEASLERILAMALASPGSFCNLVLRPLD